MKKAANVIFCKDSIHAPCVPPEMRVDTVGMGDYKEIISFSLSEFQQIIYTGLTSQFAHVPCVL